MAEYTMHHLVIGENTYEIVDSTARLEADETKQEAYAAFATDTASGTVASFSDGADGVPVKSLSVGIEPAQSGSGDPSPTNIRPISGWDAVKVFGTGKNLFDPTKLTTQHAWKDVKLDLPEGTYTMSDTLVEGSLSLYFILVGGTKSAATKVHSTHPVTLTISAGQKAQISFRRASGEDVFSNYTYQIEVGSTATDYEPYNGTVYDIDLPQTVYGGTLDVGTGVLTVDSAFIASYNGETLPSTWISDRDVYAAGTTPTTGAQVCYKLATPQTIQLTPTEVTTLLGQNNVYADAGEVSVTYRADTGLYIQKVINA